MHSVDPSAAKRSSILGEIWKTQPEAPRGVAALVHFAETQIEVEDYLGSGEHEVAAAVLAASYPSKEAFETSYRLPWRLAVRTFLDAHDRAAELGLPNASVEPELIPAERLLRRLGYVDGRGGLPAALYRRTDDSKMNGVRTPEDLIEAARLGAGVSRVLGPAYDLGWRVGRATRVLSERAPDLREAIDAEAATVARLHGSIAEAHHALNGVYREKVASHMASSALAVQEADEAIHYAIGRALAVREHHARRALQARMSKTFPVAIVAVGRSLRQIAEELSGAGGGETVQALRDEATEALALLAASGVSGATAREFTLGSDDAIDILARAHRDLGWGRRVRELYRLLGPSWVEEDTLRALDTEPRSRGGSREESMELGWTQDGIHQAARALAQGPAECGGDGTVRAACGIAGLARQVGLEQADEAVARVIARHVSADDVGGAAKSAGSSTAFLAGESLLVGEAQSWSDALESALTHRASVAKAEALLSTRDPSALWRVRAEAELATSGPWARSEAAEQWVGAYREEARRLWSTSAEADAEEATELLARARILEEGLNEWAIGEASRLLGSVLDVEWLASSGADGAPRGGAFQGVLARAVERARRMVVVREIKYPNTSARIGRALRAAALEWLWKEQQAAVSEAQ